MPRINLLPWRAELRQKRKKDFMTAVLLAMLVGGATVYLSKLTVQGWTEAQEERNNILKAEITQLDEQIAQIATLETERDRLLARMSVIDRLQRARPEIVHFFDEVASMVPSGSYLTSLKQQGNRVEFLGVAESNGRISDILRFITASPWLTDYDLGPIKNPNEGANPEFQLSAMQVTSSDDAAAAGETR